MTCIDDATLDHDADSLLFASWTRETVGGLDDDGLLLDAFVKSLERLNGLFVKTRKPVKFAGGQKVAATLFGFSRLR